MVESSTNNRVGLTAHTFSHTKEKPHKCLTCSATFGHLSNLQMHIKTVHSGVKLIQKNNSECPLCNYKCSDPAKLKAHLQKHSSQRYFSCSVPSCSFKTIHRNSLRGHISGFHLRETPYECKWDGCSYKTSVVGNLYRHLRIHSKDRPFACKVAGCNYTCKTKPCLTSHVNGVHSDEKRWKCSTCDFKTKHRAALNAHQTTHNSTKRFQCRAPNCHYASKYKNGVAMHFDRRHRKQEISCTEPGCKYRCGSNAVLKIHHKNHKLPILKCPSGSCNYSARLKKHLLIHISRHHEKLAHSPVEPKGPHSANNGERSSPKEMKTRHCPFSNCDYRTDYPHRYDRHIKTHDKKFKLEYGCKFCSSRFTLRSTLESHIKRHIGEKPYRCSHCDYTSVDGGTLRCHAQRLHNIFVIPRWTENQRERKCRTCNMTSSSYSEFTLHSMTHLKPVVLLERLRVRFL